MLFKLLILLLVNTCFSTAFAGGEAENASSSSPFLENGFFFNDGKLDAPQEMKKGTFAENKNGSASYQTVTDTDVRFTALSAETEESGPSIYQAKYQNYDGGHINKESVITYDKNDKNKIARVLTCSKTSTGHEKGRCAYYDKAFCEQILKLNLDNDMFKLMENCNNIFSRLKAAYASTTNGWEKSFQTLQERNQGLQSSIKKSSNQKIKERFSNEFNPSSYDSEDPIQGVEKSFTDIAQDQSICSTYAKDFGIEENKTQNNASKDSKVDQAE